MKTNQDDNKIVQKPVRAGRVEIYKSLSKRYLREIILSVRSVAHRETIVTQCQFVVYNRQNADFPLVDPFTFCHYPAG